MIIGTAGHIDHGKTALVRALTGVETDRLPEEQARGITLDLGFAYQEIDSGEVLGFVDVPGHERLMHNMVAGAAGIDYVILVVAADDGPMPQTREHLEILDLLGLERGLVALTKIDRVPPARVSQAAAEVRALLQGRALAEAPVFPVNALSGDGIAPLARHLHGAAADLPARRGDGRFRLAVDRSFSIAGAGTVVTGIVLDGRVRPGDRLLVSPAGHPVRVRRLHAQGRPAQEGRAGQRCALNLADLHRDAVGRGDLVLAPALHLPTRRLDLRLRVLAGEPAPLKHWTPVHCHLGAAHLTGRVAELDEAGRAQWGPRIEAYAEECDELALACGHWAKDEDAEALGILDEISREESRQSIGVKASALNLAAEIQYKKGEWVQAIGQLDAALAMPRVPVQQVAMALIFRGLTYGQIRESEKEIADYSAAINLAQAPVEHVARAFINRGLTYGQLGDIEKEIADYSQAIDLPQAPTKEVARALINRGIAYGQLGNVEKEIADYSAAIDLPQAPAEQVAWALVDRGVACGECGDMDKEIADYSAAIDLQQAPAEPVARALVNRGLTYWQSGEADQSERDLDAALRLEGAPTEIRVDSQIALAELRIATGRWDDAITALSDGLQEGTSATPAYQGDSTDIIGAFFDSSLQPAIRAERARHLLQVYRDSNALAQLGGALTQHLGRLHADPANLPSPDNLETWATAWEAAGQGIDAFRLPLRLFRTGVDFLKAGGTDRGILLDLNQEERKLLEQVFNLEAES